MYRIKSMPIEVLPRLWIGDNLSANDRTFFNANNIRYVVNFNYDIPNYFKYVTYYNIQFESDDIKEENLSYNIEELFDMINQFITKGYQYGIGIYLHDKTGNVAALFACAFMIRHLKLTLEDVVNYFKIHHYDDISYLLRNKYLMHYGKLIY